MVHAGVAYWVGYDGVVWAGPGQWRLTVRIDGPEGLVSTTHEAQVVERSAWRWRYLLIGLPLIIVALFVVLWRGLGKRLKMTCQEKWDDLVGKGYKIIRISL